MDWSLIFLYRSLDYILVVDIDLTSCKYVFLHFTRFMNHITFSFTSIQRKLFGLFFRNNLFHSKQFLLQFGNAWLTIIFPITFEIIFLLTYVFRSFALNQICKRKLTIFGGWVLIAFIIVLTWLNIIDFSFFDTKL